MESDETNKYPMESDETNKYPMESDETNKYPMESDETNIPWNRMKQPSIEIIQNLQITRTVLHHCSQSSISHLCGTLCFTLSNSSGISWISTCLFTDAPGVLNVQFERTEVGLFYKQNHPFITPHVTEDGIVPFEAMRDSILPKIISHYPKLTLAYYDTLLYVGPYTQTFWTMKRKHPNHWKLDSYLQMKPLRHSPDKKVFTSLNDLLMGKEDWVRELLKNGSGEPFDEP
ncbi:hypothetical protein TNCV_1994971 [Trichonephila clavipes]|uniref:Uncharacterized protein n=1 Tax=Trichonephila clavipes TaxID=2585209 RepID=A0A8X6R340_TRICX|nr:hypothetical protein TNCV_1994971 [Trichonephila clavipes]